MRRVLIAAIAYIMLTASTAWGLEAIDYYNLGLNSSLAYKRIQYFSKALELNPTLVEAYENRAIHFFYQRKFDKAIKDYIKAIELKPQLTEAYRMLGLAHLRIGKPAAAISYLNRAVELDPKLASAYGHRAEAYRLEGMAEEALRDSSMAIDLRGDERTRASAYGTRAKVYRELGNEELADADFKKSVELDPHYIIYRYLAGTADLEQMRRMGLFGIVGILFVGIFKLALPVPRKTDRS